MSTWPLNLYRWYDITQKLLSISNGGEYQGYIETMKDQLPELIKQEINSKPSNKKVTMARCLKYNTNLQRTLNRIKTYNAYSNNQRSHYIWAKGSKNI